VDRLRRWRAFDSFLRGVLTIAFFWCITVHSFITILNVSLFCVSCLVSLRLRLCAHKKAIDSPCLQVLVEMEDDDEVNALCTIFVLFRKDWQLFLCTRCVCHPRILPLTRLCNLLWYVCSRGPLRPIFLIALLRLLSLLPLSFHIRALHHRLVEDPAVSLLACPLDTRDFMS
jgi:hypothetical protein